MLDKFDISIVKNIKDNLYAVFIDRRRWSACVLEFDLQTSFALLTRYLHTRSETQFGYFSVASRNDNINSMNVIWI